MTCLGHCEHAEAVLHSVSHPITLQGMQTLQLICRWQNFQIIHKFAAVCIVWWN